MRHRSSGQKNSPWSTIPQTLWVGASDNYVLRQQNTQRVRPAACRQSFLFRNRGNSYTVLLAQKIKKPQRKHIRYGTEPCSAVPPIFALSGALQPLKQPAPLRGKRQSLLWFSPAARGRPSLSVSRVLAPTAPSLCFYRKILLPFIAIWVHYSLGRGFCQQLLCRRS